MEDKKIGIALSGGGARGIAHIGVLQALEDHLIYPTSIAGASAGSIVGALYASGLRPKRILEIFKANSIFKIVKLGLPMKGLTKLDGLKEQLANNIKLDSFEGLQKKLFVSVCNLNSGQAEIIDSGDLFEIILASCSIPLVFQPVTRNGIQYVDGGLMLNLPVEPLRAISDYVIGVNVMPKVEVPIKEVDSIFDIAVRSFELSLWNNTRVSQESCDCVIEPEALRNYNILNFSKTQEIYDIGYAAAMEKIPEILKLIL